MTNRRGEAKAKKEAHKRSRRARRRRDAVVTELYGDAGHRSCGKKARYDTEGMARSIAARYMALGAPRLRGYECQMCGGWHLTSKEVKHHGKGHGEAGAQRRGA